MHTGIYHCALIQTVLVLATKMWSLVCLQIGFFSIVGIPMYKALVGAFEDARPLLDGVMGNYKCWEAAAASGKDPCV